MAATADARPAERATPAHLATVAPLGARPVPFWIGTAVAAVVAIGIATYAADKFIPRPTPSTDASIAQPPAAESAAGQAALPPGGSPDSGGESPHDDGARADVAAGTLVANPTDSARASAFAVAVAEVASETSANVTIDDESRKGLPALTVSPEEGKPPSGPLLVVSGAFNTRFSADSMLRALRRRGALRPAQGHITELPLSILVQTGVAASQAAFFTHGYRLKGLPVYALMQADGSVNLYAGAFNSIDAAQPLLYRFRANGDQPRVAYRIGRVF